ncbi:SDR family NAD(P)-dependent oxidoreductase [Cryobacterium frigoriphilum]|uniref:SDR family NAD(P)-dependent oxidoreductase n=1 Tax=Cryobacterium frigoriphilum TaxID=1259150 RepID=A0A4R8ZW91_9MICO|nr:SDR family NAD(P)-dependent oxidoreductase [Cryobacterium frigoriphilum]TFD47858.1 SDR family NAD(P)-dependent oxidoreductase [Cryobacterium frigoriphilum]
MTDPGAVAGVAGRLVLIAGASSAAGRAVASALTDAGARVIAVGSNAARLAPVAAAARYECDLANFEAVTALADRVHAEHGPVDGLIHLVGGWRGGGGLAGQTDEDWDFLHDHVLTTLRNTTRVFNADLLASSAGRLAIVSSVSVDKPTPGGANYAAAKAAAETWVRAIGQGFAKAGDAAATAIFVVRSLEGLEAELATRVVGLWAEPAAAVNNTRVTLAAP